MALDRGSLHRESFPHPKRDISRSPHLITVAQLCSSNHFNVCCRIAMFTFIPVCWNRGVGRCVLSLYLGLQMLSPDGFGLRSMKAYQILDGLSL